MLNLMLIVMSVVGVIIFVFAEQLIHYIVAPNLTPEQLHNATTIMRLVAFNPLLFTISGIFTSVQQTFGRFFFYALAPVIYNVTIIASIYIFKDSLGLIGLGVGALIGAGLQLLISMFGFIGLRYKYRPIIKWTNTDFIQILKNLPPRALDQGIDSINSIAETNFARRLGEGNLSYYENAFALQSAPSILIGTSISTAAFPRLSERLSQGRKDLFRKDFLKILSFLVWIILPVVIVGFFTRGYLARLIFTRDAPEIALIFGFFAGAIFFRTLYAFISRWFYAQKDTRSPLFVSLFAICLNIYLAYSLSKSHGVEGLALAQSIVAFAEVAILGTVMVVRDHKLIDKDFWFGIFQIFSVTGFTVIAGFIMITIFPLNSADKGFLTLGTKLVAISGVTVSVHIAMSILFGLDEAKPVVKKIKKLILNPIKI
jgi:putative peptidoglycan lipid II flippase